MSAIRRHSLLLALATAFFEVPAAAQVTNQFDLTCAVKFIDSSRDRSYEAKANQTSLKFRLDLTIKRYCEDKCDSLNEIKLVNEGSILLSSERGSDYGYRKYINRLNGAYEESYGFRGVGGYSGTGSCIKKPFTGFPTKRF